MSFENITVSKVVIPFIDDEYGRFPRKLKPSSRLAVVASVVEPSSGKESAKIGSSTLLERDHRAYTSLFQALKAFAVIDCIADAVCASSTDGYPDESIANTLDPRERNLWGYSYWSSQGQSDPDVPESLIYRLHATFCIITEINIKPFLAYFQPGLPIYSGKSLRFRVGHFKSSADVESILCNFKRNNGIHFIGVPNGSGEGHFNMERSWWLVDRGGEAAYSVV
ncbi:hypothetical protein RJ639_032545 [Escallonia herrerae]|uniref:Uncharacterized protein n=1 Tax=Escallonia herrerae TaxID=1293975 RepID=A0AA88WWS5_9ASTE|nr:hypothetical protein RJ639_032545 [Escallonia herrerae]